MRSTPLVTKTKFKFRVCFQVLAFAITIHSESIAQDSLKVNENGGYSFIVKDDPARLFTMRQFNQNYLSSYRIVARELNKELSKKLSIIIQAGISALFTIPLSHEEGHRSILTEMQIGSISKPFFNSNGAAYVVGVTDATLIDLRDNNLPKYIRLHTGGLESDYMLTNRIETIAAFEFDEIKNIYIEYVFRKLAIISYYLFSTWPALQNEIVEENNELQRDIVGHDVYGAIRNLHRPVGNFFRYTNYSDLTDEEKDFVKRVSSRSLLNFMNPLIIGKQNFPISGNLKVLVGLGYSMAPFGDFIDENIWLKFNNSIFTHIYFRQYQNQTKWFPAVGLRISQFPINQKLIASLAGHYWSQPKSLSFTTRDNFNGFAIDATLKYKFQNNAETKKWYSLDIGMIYKSEGFLPEELVMSRHFGWRIGFSFN